MEFAAFRPLLRALKRSLETGTLGYTRAGSSSYNTICAWYGALHNISVAPTEIVQFPFGPRAALGLIGRALLGLEDVVLVPTPTYGGLLKFAHPAIAIKWPMQRTERGWDLDFDSLEDILTTHKVTTVALCNPNNPLGLSITKPSLDRLLARLAQTSSVRLVISDEVHGDLIYPGRVHTSILSVDMPKSMTAILLSSFGKTFNVSGLPGSFAVARPTSALQEIRARLSRDGFHEGGLIGNSLHDAIGIDGRAWRDCLVQYLSSTADFVYQRFQRQLPAIQLTLPHASFLISVHHAALGPAICAQIAGRFASGGVRLSFFNQFGCEEVDGFRYLFGTSRERIGYEIDYISDLIRGIDCSV